MIAVTYVDYGGAVHQVLVEEGTTLMEGAINNNIMGIEADCGGSCACATCHIYIDQGWQSVIPLIKPLEQNMLNFALGVAEGSRLSCQIYATKALDGLVVRLPERQI